MRRLLLLIILLIPYLSSAQLDLEKLRAIKAEKGDVKVGVVLSGGGAKGVAHVGALRMMENAGIRIDYIGGTSMGAIVSSLYAIGYTVDQLDSIIRFIDMSKMVSGQLDRKYKTYVSKRFDNKTFAKLPINNGKIGLPGGLSNGQDVIDSFNELTRSAHGDQDFNEFKTPLVIMGTDIVTGESVEFHSGSLPLSMRASSSFPSLFAPVEVGDRLMVDGGVANNFPVQEVINLGADVVIGVSVEDGLYSRKDLTSINTIIEQITSFKMVEKSRKQKEKLDVFVKPDITGYSVVSFDKADDIIERGEIAGFEHFNEFIEIAKVQNGEIKNNEKLILKDEYLIKSVSVSKVDNYESDYFLDKFKLEDFPVTMTINQIKEGIQFLKGTDNFDMLSYSLVKQDDDSYILKLDVKEKPVKDFVKVGIHYDNLYNAGALVNYTAHNRLLKSSYLMINGIISEKPRYNLVYYKDNSIWPGFLFESSFNHYQVDVPISAFDPSIINLLQGSVFNREVKDWTSKFLVQKTLWEDFFIGVGAEYKWIDIYSRSLRVTNPDGSISNEPYVLDYSSNLNLIAEMHADTRDDPDYPTRGFHFSADYRFINVLESNLDIDAVGIKKSNLINLDFEFTIPIAPSVTWINQIVASARFDGFLTQGMQYSFGGYNKNNINSNHTFFGYETYGIASADDDKGFYKIESRFQFGISENWFLLARANVLQLITYNQEMYEVGNIDYTGYALTLANKSMLGPVELTGSYSPELNKFILMFNFGFWF